MIPIPDPDEVEGEFDLIEYLENKKQFAGKIIPAIYQMIQSRKPLAEGGKVQAIQAAGAHVREGRRRVRRRTKFRLTL